MEHLHQFLDQHRVEKGGEFTHTSLGYPKGAFFVPSDRRDDFQRAYISALESGAGVYLTERHKEVGPCVVDLDFRFAGCDLQRRYTEQHMHIIARVYGRAIAELLDVQFPLRAVFMQKTSPSTYPSGVKDGLHIVFPGVVTPPAEQQMLRADVLRLLPVELEAAGFRPSNTWGDVVDDAVIVRNNWTMYGSSKPNCEPYKVCCVYEVHRCDGDGASMEVRDVTEDSPHPDDWHHWVPTLSIRNKLATARPLESRHRDMLAFEEAMNIRALQAAQRAAGKGQHMAAAMSRSRNSDDYETAKKFVAVLKAERAETYDTWIKVGWCLYNIDQRLLPDWVEFSKKSPKYKDGECERLWATSMRPDCLGMGSLSKWAKDDAPHAHTEINRERIRTLVVRSCNGDQATHHDVARVIHHMYRDMFVCASIRARAWYEFREHRWRPTDSAYTLRQLISTEVYSEYVAAGAYFQERASLNARDTDVESQSDSQKCLDRVKRINGVALKLKNVGFKEALIKELSEMFYREGFEEKLNCAGHLLGFNNGVYDLDANVFRDGQPGDYVSFTTGYDFVPPDEQHPANTEIQDFFRKVFVNERLRAYVINTLASCLHGGVRYERYNMWHGEQGANGKSKLLDLMEQTFGDYSVKFPVSLLTQKRVASNSATSELARSKGRRFASMQEPGESETLNIGIMKELSGNDRIVARHLFHEAIEFRPFYKMFMCCNHLPAVPSQDGGTWRRIRVVQFTSRFCENPDPSNPEEFAVDYDIDKKFEHWKPHMMGLLLKVFPSVRNGIPEPPEVMEYTMQYKRSNDSVTQFLDQCVRRGSPKDNISVTGLYREFNQWKRRESQSTNTLPRAEFKCVAQQYFGVKGESFQGYRIISEEEEAEEARAAAQRALEAQEQEEIHQPLGHR